MSSKSQKSSDVKKLSAKVTKAIKNVKTLDKRIADLYKIVLINKHNSR